MLSKDIDSIESKKSRVQTVARLLMLRKGRKFFSRVKTRNRNEDEPHACAVTDRLRIQGQPMTPDTVADGAETRVGEVNERQGDLWERARGGGRGGWWWLAFERVSVRKRVGKWWGWRERGGVHNSRSSTITAQPLPHRCCSGFHRKTFSFAVHRVPCNLLSSLLSSPFRFTSFLFFLFFFFLFSFFSVSLRDDTNTMSMRAQLRHRLSR